MKAITLLTLSSVSTGTTLVQDSNSEDLEHSSTTIDEKISSTPSTSIVIETPIVEDGTNFCKIDKDQRLGPNCDVSIREINEVNRKIRKDVVGLVSTDFFKYFKFDPEKKCTIWENNEGICFSRGCSIDFIEDWDSLPAYWQPEVLGSVSNETADDLKAANEMHKYDDSFLNELCGAGHGKDSDDDDDDSNLLVDEDTDNADNLNYFDVNDFRSKNAILLDLTANPERFTGYGGQEAGQIWKSIYAENCFSCDHSSESCLAKDAFFRIVSGMHASIGTHLSNEYLNTETGEWEPNLDLFMARVGNFPDRVSNIYFNYAIVAKSLWKIRPYLCELDFCNDYDNDVKARFINIVSQLDSKIFDESVMFKDDLSSTLKDDFRRRFKNITKIMDCVHCDRCKLWGKVQTTGYATSLKILFELDESDEVKRQQVVNNLTKYELIALLNTFDRLSKSIESINNFERMYNERLNGTTTVKKVGKVSAFFSRNNFFKLFSKARDTIIDRVQKFNDSSYGNSISRLVAESLLESDQVAEEEEESDKIDTQVSSEVSELEQAEETSSVVGVTTEESEEHLTETSSGAVSEESVSDDLTITEQDTKLHYRDVHVDENMAKFEDLKFPEGSKKKVITTEEGETGTPGDNILDQNLWLKAWRAETHNFAEALRFIWQSYLDLPRNIWNMCLVTFSRMWNWFIGVAGYLNEDEVEQNVYTLDFH